jgi:glycosyltransferase involved in cell wall biosynthesis
MTTDAPLRVLVHLNNLELGGTQINAVDLAAQMRSHGVESVLVGPVETIPDGPSLLQVASALDIEIHAYQQAGPIFARARQVSAFARRHRVDLVHVYGSWGGGTRPTYWGPSRFGRTPWLQTVYEMSVPPKNYRHMPLIVGTHYQRDDEQDRPGRTILISPPVNLAENRPDASSAARFRADHAIGDAPLLVIVSRLDVIMKTVPALAAIDAMRELAPTGAILVIVGTGNNVAALQARADEVNAAVGRAAVRLIGPMADPRPAYAAADIMLGMGGSAARSLAFAKPLVAQGEAGWSMLFEPSSAEFVARSSYWSPDVEPEAAARLVAIVAPLIADPARRAELGRFGREFAEKRFSLTAMADLLAGFYRSVLGEYSSRDWIADLPLEGRMLAGKIARISRQTLRMPPVSGEGA